MEQQLFGLIGKNISYSFSKRYFTERFSRDGLRDHRFENFDLNAISDFAALLASNPDLRGLCVTIPYKETIIPYLDHLSDKAAKIGAVNMIRISKKGKLKGYNTDAYGFEKSLVPLLRPHHKKALILGTGGASKAVAFTLEKLGINYSYVSRNPSPNAIGYDRINSTTFDNHQIFINCTPLGTSPDTAKCPPLPYEYFTPKHLAYDLIYNPEKTLFLQKAEARGAAIKNGLQMLILQAEKSWKIWNR